MFRESIQRAIVELIEELHQESRRLGFDDVKLIPHLPADPKSLDLYEQYLQCQLPPSYRAFLELHNGYEGLAFGGDMLSIEDVMPGGRRYDEIRRWKRMCADYGSGEVLDGIVIANSEQPNKWVYLDPNRPLLDGEFLIIRWMGDSYQEYTNLVEFFRALARTCRLDLEEGPSNSQRGN